jgi:DNA-binding beta-propeller fold protein YncE
MVRAMIGTSPATRRRGLALLLLLAGCAPARPPTPAPASPGLVWPPPPAPPRVRFVQSISEPGDLGLHPSWWRRVLTVLVGPLPQDMVRPVAVAVQGGRIAVADPGVPAVHLFAPDGYRRLTAAGATALVSPVGVALAVDGSLFVADSALGRVLRYDADGDPRGAIEDPELRRPTGLAWSEAEGRLYVTDTLAHRISVYDRAGARVATIGHRGTGAGELNYPGFLALGPGGELLVSDVLNFRVVAFAPDSERVAWSFGRAGDGSGDLARPKGVAVDARGHVYVADALFDAVQIFDRKGHLLLAVGARGRGPGQFWMPAGLCTDGADRLYVADAYNRRVQVFEYVGGEETE